MVARARLAWRTRYEEPESKTTESMQLIQGGKRRVYGSLDRAMHSAFCQVHGADGSVPSEAIYDIRRNRQHPWRKLAKRIEEAHYKETPVEQVREIVRVLELYIDELYGEAS